MSEPLASARIDALFRYPVKSMLGERVESVGTDERGLAGDRGFALVDQETGKIASAKNPRRWGMLFECLATYVEEPQAGAELPPALITLPGGASVRSDDARVHQTLSQFVGRPVRLESVAPVDPVIEVTDPDSDAAATVDESIAIVAPDTFFDAAPLHLVSTATLARLRELAPGCEFPPARFRPNVVVSVDVAPGFVDNDWVGHSLALGADVRASVFLTAPRCVMTTLPQSDLPRDPGVLQTVARHNRIDIPGLGPSSCVGVYALVVTGGAMCRDDVVVIT